MDKLTLCNLALGRLGTQSSITDLTEDSPEAYNTSLFFGPTIDATLSAHDWTFAKSQAVLAIAGTAPRPWRFQYVLPADSIRAVRLVPVHGILGMPKFRIPYEVRQGLDGGGNIVPTLCTNENAAVLDYISRVENPAYWSASFCEAFSWHLAAMVAIPITGKGELMQSSMSAFQRSVDVARAMDASQHTANANFIPDFMSVRGLPGDWPSDRLRMF